MKESSHNMAGNARKTAQDKEGIEEIREAAERLAEAERLSFCPAEPVCTLPALKPADTKIKGRLVREPPTAEYIMTCRGYPFFKKGIVALLISAGGLGKTFLMLRLAMLLSRSSNWGCFEVEKALKVLYIGAEDDQDELDRRLWTIGKGFFPETLHAVSVVGKVGTLMKLDGENPVRSEWYDWLKATIEAHGPLDVLFLDPLSRLYGLVENRNEHATSFISALEALAIEYKITIMISHHANKLSADQTKAKQGMSRGASGFIDGCRFALGLVDVSAEDTANYSIESPEQYFKLDVVKSNNSAKLSGPVFFKKNQDTGLPEYVNLSMDRIANMAIGFYQAFAEHGKEVKERDLLRGDPKELFDLVKGNLQKLTISKDMKPILSYLVEHEYLIETMETGRGGTWKNLAVKNTN